MSNGFTFQEAQEFDEYTRLGIVIAIKENELAKDGLYFNWHSFTWEKRR